MRSVMREMSVFAGVVTCTKVCSVSAPLRHSSQITAIAIGWASCGVMTHCLVLPFGSSSPSLKVWTMRMPRAEANACANVGSASTVSPRACMCLGRVGTVSSLPANPHRISTSSRSPFPSRRMIFAMRIGVEITTSSSSRLSPKRLGEGMHILPRVHLGKLTAHRFSSCFPVSSPMAPAADAA